MVLEQLLRKRKANYNLNAKILEERSNRLMMSWIGTIILVSFSVLGFGAELTVKNIYAGRKVKRHKSEEAGGF